MATDLFGTDSPLPAEPKRDTILKRWERFATYRKAEKGSRARCKYCTNCCMKVFGRHHYYKCIMVGCSNGPATDIRANHTCKFFDPCPETALQRWVKSF